MEAGFSQIWSHISLSGLGDEDAQKQVQALTLYFSHEMLSIVQNLGLAEVESKKVESIIFVIKCYIDGHINETVERRISINQRNNSKNHSMISSCFFENS